MQTSKVAKHLWKDFGELRMKELVTALSPPVMGLGFAIACLTGLVQLYSVWGSVLMVIGTLVSLIATGCATLVCVSITIDDAKRYWGDVRIEIEYREPARARAAAFAKEQAAAFAAEQAAPQPQEFQPVRHGKEEVAL